MKNFLANNKIIILIAIVGFLFGVIVYLFQNQKPAEQSLIFEENLGSNEVALEVSSTQPEIGGQPIAKEQTNIVAGCASYLDAGKFIGEEKCVTGKVDNIYVSSGGTTFFDFCPDYKTCAFSAVIFKSDSFNFPEAKQYQGKTVEITGLVKTYQGRPEIILNNADQIKIK